MANRRMISKSISISKTLAKASDSAALLYTWLIPHCDDGGNMDADPLAVKGIVVPMRPVSVDDVANDLSELEQLGAISFYEAVNGGSEIERFLHINKFERHQTLRTDRLDKRFPDFGKPVVNQAATAGKPNVTERNVTELNITEPNGGGDVTKTKEQPTTTDVQKIVNHFFELKGWENKDKDYYAKNKIIYGRYTKPAKELLDICHSEDQGVEYASDRMDRVASWAKSRKLDWSLDTVIKKYLEIDQLTDKEKKPFYKGQPMYQRSGKWYIAAHNGEHLEYGFCLKKNDPHLSYE
jgi:hypothetical protein